MNNLKSNKINCPYCGEMIWIQIDCSIENQTYIEDCQVCCRPIHINVTVNEDAEVEVYSSREDD